MSTSPRCGRPPWIQQRPASSRRRWASSFARRPPTAPRTTAISTGGLQRERGFRTARSAAPTRARGARRAAAASIAFSACRRRCDRRNRTRSSRGTNFPCAIPRPVEFSFSASSTLSAHAANPLGPALRHDGICEADSWVIFRDRLHPRRFVQLRARRFEPAPRLIRDGWPFDVGEETLHRDVSQRAMPERQAPAPRQTLDRKACQAAEREKNGRCRDSYLLITQQCSVPYGDEHGRTRAQSATNAVSGANEMTGINAVCRRGRGRGSNPSGRA